MLLPALILLLLLASVVLGRRTGTLCEIGLCAASACTEWSQLSVCLSKPFQTIPTIPSHKSFQPMQVVVIRYCPQSFDISKLTSAVAYSTSLFIFVIYRSYITWMNHNFLAVTKSVISLKKIILLIFEGAGCSCWCWSLFYLLSASNYYLLSISGVSYRAGCSYGCGPFFSLLFSTNWYLLSITIVSIGQVAHMVVDHFSLHRQNIISLLPSSLSASGFYHNINTIIAMSILLSLFQKLIEEPQSLSALRFYQSIIVFLIAFCLYNLV